MVKFDSILHEVMLVVDLRHVRDVQVKASYSAELLYFVMSALLHHSPCFNAHLRPF